MTMFIMPVWPSLYCHLTHSLTHLQASFTAPGFGSFTSLLGTGCSLSVVTDPFLQQSLQPPRPSSLQILQLRAGPLHSQLGPCHSLSVRKLPQKMDLWDSRRKKCLSPKYEAKTHKRGQTLSGKRRLPKIKRGQEMVPGVPWNRKAFEGSQLWKSLMLVFSMESTSYKATLLSEPCYMHSVHVHTDIKGTLGPSAKTYLSHCR